MIRTDSHMEKQEARVALQEAEVEQLLREVELLLCGDQEAVEPEELVKARVENEKLKFRLNILKRAVQKEQAHSA